MSTRDHHPYGPSRLPMLAKCPCFESKEEAGDAAAEGTAWHEAAEAILKSLGRTNGDAFLASLTSDEARESVVWYVEEIRAFAEMNHLEIEVEQRLEMVRNFDVVYFGTVDAITGPVIWDLKSNREPSDDYRLQMAALAMMLMQQRGFVSVECRVCYGRLKRIESYTFTAFDAGSLVIPIIQLASAADKKPTAFDHCDWCRHVESCEAVVTPVVAAAIGYSPDDYKAIVEWHSSEVSDVITMARMKRVAKIVTAWAESVDHHCREMMIKQGMEVPGYRLQERQGALAVVEIQKAYELSGLPVERFMACCNVKVTTLVEQYAEQNGVKKAQAKRDLIEKLAPVLVQQPSIVCVVESKGG